MPIHADRERAQCRSSILDPKNDATVSDAWLLGHFIDHKDEAAFEALVRRHGPSVLRVCRRVLNNFNDADDAFQATFMVLARKAASIRHRHMVASWLYGVALQTSLRARKAASRRNQREKLVMDVPEPFGGQQLHERLDLQPILHEELGRLPEKYRLPIVLCFLENRMYKAAAKQLGWRQGTLSGRLSRARAMLAKRLTRRGVTMATVAGYSGRASNDDTQARLAKKIVVPSQADILQVVK